MMQHAGKIAGGIAILLSAAFVTGTMAVAEGGEQKPKGGWVTGAPDDATRFKHIEKYLRGFDQPMWEVGERYEKIHDALSRRNFDLALYHWDKIKVTIENGTMKRPARKANADAMFLDETWQDLRDDFASRNSARAWAAFGRARTTCMACHQAEQVEFVNDQSLFQDLLPPESD